MPITVIIHSLNEEKNIADCIISARLLTDEIILIDMESTDKTIEITNRLNVPIYNFPRSNYVEPAREFGIKQAKTDWVMILDADERITKELANEIKDITKYNQIQSDKISKKTDYIRLNPIESDSVRLHPIISDYISQYKIPRRNTFAGIKWLKHGGWWPDYQTRLINKKYFIGWPKRIHSTPKIKGKIGYLKNPLIHYFHGDLNGMVKKTIIFEDIESDLLFKAKRKTGIGIFFRKYLAELYRRLIKNLGFLDGPFGIIEAIYQAFSKTITYLFLYEKQNQKACLPVGRVGLYDPYLDTLGGGEKHILSIMDVFADLGYEVNIFWDKNLTKEIKNRFNLRCIDTSKYLLNIFKKKPSTLRTLQTLKTLKTFDYFFYVTDGSYFFSGAKNNFVFCMVPDKKLYNLNLLNRLKLWNYKFISNSPFTTKSLNKLGINPITITPYIENKIISNNKNKTKKEKIILSVGRFFPHLHSKRQDLAIKTFLQLKSQSKEFSDYKLILAGGLMKEDQKYFNQLKSLAKNDSSIKFKPNIKLYELYKLYKLSNYFWHFAGYGVDEEKNPEQVEHFGITPLEAMASGCLTFCYSAGGPKELIVDGENGFLFSNEHQLIDKMIKVDLDGALKANIRKNGIKFVKENFSYKIFQKKVVDLFRVRPSTKD